MDISATTPDRPTKRFRNETSPLRGAAMSAWPPARTIWEWSSNSGVWNEYSSEKASALEDAFGNRDVVILPGDGEYVVDLSRFVQINLATNRERKIRRRISSQEPSQTPAAPAIRHFDGTTVFLNRIATSEPNSDTLAFSDLVSPAGEIESVFLTSYGTDIEWLLSHFRAGTPITLIDQPPVLSHESSSVFPLGQLWPQFQVIHPKLGLSHGASGTMHCKLIIIQWKDGRGLRIIISSANLAEYDWIGLTQCIYVVDIGPTTDSAPAATNQSVGTDLCGFVDALLDGSHSVTPWKQTLRSWEARINQQTPAGVYLIPSIPGTHTGAKRSKFGQLRLRQLLANSFGPPTRDSSVQYQISSIGALQGPFMKSFIESVDSTEIGFKIVWPEYSKAMPLAGHDHVMLAEKNAANAMRYMTPFTPLESRADMLNHSKIIICPNKWCYVGSHNLSMSAWGVPVLEDRGIRIASYELGILITDPTKHGIKINIPFTLRGADGVPPPLLHDKPWMVDAFRRTLCLSTDQVNPKEMQGISVWVSDAQDDSRSFATFLSDCSRSNGFPLVVILEDPSNVLHETVSEYITKTLIPFAIGKAEIFRMTFPKEGQVPLSSSYFRHIAARLKCSEFPCIIVMDPGSDLQRGLSVRSRVCGSNILQIEPHAFLSDSFRVDLCQQDGNDVDEIDAGSAATGEANPLPTKSQPCHSHLLSYIVENKIALLCVDVDGTLVESNTSSVLMPFVVEFLSQLKGKSIKLALVTNQGAVGLRHWMTVNSFGDPASLPTQEEVETRIAAVAEQVKRVCPDIPLRTYMAFRYQSKGDPAVGKAPRWGPVPFAGKGDPRWEQDWRKPGPGMITSAMRWAGLSIFDKQRVLMVGDMDSDEGAAHAAGVRFKRAPECFTE